MISQQIPSDFPGNEFMGENVRKSLKACATSAKLFPLAKLCKPEVIEIGEMARIHDFVFMWGGHGIRIGRYNDIQPFVNIWGGGEAILGNFISVGGGSQLLTATYDYQGYRMVDGIPPDHTNTLYGTLVIEDDVYVGVNCTIMPNVRIGEGAVIGGGSFVNKNVDPWSIYVGSPAKKIGERPPLKQHIVDWDKKQLLRPSI